MKRTVIALGIVFLIGMLAGTSVVKESRTAEGFGETINQFCPSTPYTGDCGRCHDSSAAMTAFAASAEVSVAGATPERGASRLVGDLAYFLLPVGVVVGMRIWRRKR